MRIKGTKYETVTKLPANALPVSKFAKQMGYTSPSYVHVKYNRYQKGGNHPGYDIIDFQGTCWVINY